MAVKNAGQSRGENVKVSRSASSCWARFCALAIKNALKLTPSALAARTINFLISGVVRRSMRLSGGVGVTIENVLLSPLGKSEM